MSIDKLTADLQVAIQQAEHKPGDWAQTAQSMGGVCCPGEPFQIGKPWPQEEPWAQFSYKRDSWLAVAAVNAIPGLLAEIDRLKGLRPAAPPRPPEGESLPRYGLRWNGPQQPVAVPMADGYWAPWHLADQIQAENECFEEGMRSIASSLSAGGYNAERLSAAELVEKVRWGVSHLCDAHERQVNELRSELEALRKGKAEPTILTTLVDAELALEDLEQKALAASQAPLELSEEGGSGVVVPNGVMEVGDYVLVRQDGKLPDDDGFADAQYILASAPPKILALIASLRALAEAQETMLCGAHALGLTANVGAQDVVNAILALQTEAAGLRKDKRLLDSGMIMTSDRDEFGQAHRTHRRGLDLRKSIMDAIKEHRRDEIAGDIE